MPPAFAHVPPVCYTQSASMSTPSARLAVRVRRSSTAVATATDDAARALKRRKVDIPTPQTPSSTPAPPPVRLAVADRVLKAERAMSQRLSELTFDPPVTHVYDPLTYAWDAHEWYVKEFGNTRKDILLVGMNPGPWGMAQTGVPFGEVTAVRDWMKMPADINIAKPAKEHPKRPITGLSCERSEVSGRRLWLEWARATHDGGAHDFFRRYFVHNYCPLLFLQESGKNRTPAQLRALERQMLVEVCDEALREVVQAIRPRLVCGVGGFATERCRTALKDLVEKGLLVGTVLHPSPASPAANRGWAKQAAKTMQELIAKVSTSEDIWQAPKREDL